MAGMVTGLLDPSGGSVALDGRNIHDDLVAYKARLGYVPEEAQLYTWMSGAEYLTLCARLRGLPAEIVARRIDALLSIFDLQSDRDAPMTAYRKGMRQRILISAALIHDPSVIVFDEPCSGLDVGGRLVLRSLVRRLAADGRIILYSSHVLEMVEQVCTPGADPSGACRRAELGRQSLRRALDAASLEDAFRALVVRADVDGVAREIVSVKIRS